MAVPREDLRSRQIADDEWVVEEKGIIIAEPEKWVEVVWRKLSSQAAAERQRR
jgi:hypothetical protein